MSGPTNEEIEAQLRRGSPMQWRRLWAAVAALPPSDQITWHNGYEQRVSQMLDILYPLVIVTNFDWSRWYDAPSFPQSENHPYARGRGLDTAPVADAARVLTVFLRGEHFAEGAVAMGFEEGSVPAALARLRRWWQELSSSNPWLGLSDEAPYVLAEDAAVVENFNATASPQHVLHTELPPEPFMGDLHAPVVLLNLNPGFAGSEPAAYRDRPEIVQALLANLRAEPRDWPFTFLDPVTADTPGHTWWHRRLRPLIEAVGSERVARGVLCVEYFPYHSVRYKNLAGGVPSQRFSFHVVDQALQRDATIVVMRSRRGWESTIPELAGRTNVFALNSPQNVTISRSNCPEGFERLVERL